MPGPENGTHERWSSRLAAFLGRGASTAVNVTCAVLGGPDGVTAANRFAAQVEPDGRTLLVLSGGAALARLVGDPRARFESAGWLPVCAAESLAVVAGRTDLAAAGTVRLALAGPDAPGAAALCALGMMGLDAVPVPGLGPLQAEAALLAGSVDAVLLHGPDVPARLSALPARPWFTLDASGARDAALPEVPCMSELVSGPTVLRVAAQAAAAAARLHAALVLPALTPADRVALWRGAAARWQDEDSRTAAASGAPPAFRRGSGAAPVRGAQAAARGRARLPRLAAPPPPLARGVASRLAPSPLRPGRPLPELAVLRLVAPEPREPCLARLEGGLGEAPFERAEEFRVARDVLRRLAQPRQDRRRRAGGRDQPALRGHLHRIAELARASAPPGRKRLRRGPPCESIRMFCGVAVTAPRLSPITSTCRPSSAVRSCGSPWNTTWLSRTPAASWSSTSCRWSSVPTPGEA